MIDWKALQTTSSAGGPQQPTQPGVQPPATAQARVTGARPGQPSGGGTPPAQITTGGGPSTTSGQSQAQVGGGGQTGGYNPIAMHQIDPSKWGAWGGPEGSYQEGWYRNPGWAGHSVWHPDYGYQDWPTVYGGSSLTPNWETPGPKEQAQAGAGGGNDYWSGYSDWWGQAQPQYQQQLTDWYNQMQQQYQQPQQGQAPQPEPNYWGQDAGQGSFYDQLIGGNTQSPYPYQQPGGEYFDSRMQTDFGPTPGFTFPSGDPMSGEPSSQLQMGQPGTVQLPDSSPIGIEGSPFARAGGGTQGAGYPQGGASNFPYPQQMDTASDVMTHFAQGAPTSIPWQWDQGSDVASQFAQSGSPVDYQGWWDAQNPVLQRSIEDQSKQAAEQAGLGGMRWSTPLQRNISDIAGRETAKTFGDFMGMSLQGEEAAKGRQQQAINQLFGFGQGTAGLAESAKDRGLAAAGGLAGLGQQYFNMPMDWSRQMYGMGQQQQQMSQSALDRIYQDFMRMSPENNPWLAQAMGFGGMQSQMAPQQYQPSFMSQLLGGLGGGAMMAGGLGWSPFG